MGGGEQAAERPGDADLDDGEFLLEDLILGRYTVKEVPPLPLGFEPDPDTVTVQRPQPAEGCSS